VFSWASDDSIGPNHPLCRSIRGLLPDDILYVSHGARFPLFLRFSAWDCRGRNRTPAILLLYRTAKAEHDETP
jgi:hypothetical protein